MTMLLLLAATLPQDAPPEERPEMAWKPQPGDIFTFKWVYEERMTQERKVQEHSARTFQSREINAELTYLEKTRSGDRLSVTLKKVDWNQGDQDFDVWVQYVEGKEPKVSAKAHPASKLGQNYADRYENTGRQLGDRIAEQIKGGYVLSIPPAPGIPIFLRVDNVGGGSLFQGIYLHSILPKDGVTQGQTWMENVGRSIPFAVSLKVEPVPFMVTSLTKKAITVKGGFTLPLTETLSHLKITGQLSFLRQFAFSPEGFLQSGNEDISLEKKQDSKNKEERGETRQSVKQTVILKKTPPKEDKSRDAEVPK